MDTKKDAVVRRNPFKEVLPLADLRIAADLIGRRQIAQYWADHPTPLRPLGRVKYEGLRQLATFILPLLLIGAGMLAAKTLLALVALVPAGLALGYLLDRKLKSDIAKMRGKDDTIDRGRYAAVRQLSASTGIPASEITLKMIQKMALDFVDVTLALEAEEAAREKAALAVQLADIRRREAEQAKRRGGRNARGYRGAAGGAVAAGVAAGSIAALADDDGVLPDRLFGTSAPAVNPTTGLPMMHDTMGVDVGGTAYGTDPM